MAHDLYIYDFLCKDQQSKTHSMAIQYYYLLFFSSVFCFLNMNHIQMQYEFKFLQNETYMLQTSTAGPYVLPENISGAAYTGEPHCVLRLHSPKNTLLEPKSEMRVKSIFQLSYHSSVK